MSNGMDINNLRYSDDRRIRLQSVVTNSPGRRDEGQFHASDFGKPFLDMYFDFKGFEKTNPPTWNETLKWGAGEGVEAQMLLVLKENGWVDEDYDQDDHRSSIEREGVTVEYGTDAIHKNGNPIEIKSINNKNSFDIKRYENAEPRENYVGQLATYMDALGKDTGYLFVASVDGLNYFWFKCVRTGPGKYKCGNTEVDIYEQYRRYRYLKDHHLDTDVMPDVNEYLYKYPLDGINWKEVPKSKISKARNGHAVLGDWQVQYSDWKDKIVELQGETLGYSDEELAQIKEATKGYSTWKN